MATILVVAEQANGHLKKATLSALTAAQQVAKNTGANIAGVVIGAGAGQAAQDLAAYGIPVHVVEGAAFEHALAETHSAAAAEVAKKAGAVEVVIAATAYGKDIAPRIAAKQRRRAQLLEAGQHAARLLPGGRRGVVEQVERRQRRRRHRALRRKRPGAGHHPKPDRRVWLGGLRRRRGQQFGH